MNKESIDRVITEHMRAVAEPTDGILSIAECLVDLPEGVSHEGLAIAIQSLCGDLRQALEKLELSIIDVEKSNE